MTTRRVRIRGVFVIAATLGMVSTSAWGQWNYYFFDKPQPLELDTSRLAIFAAQNNAKARVLPDFSAWGISAEDVEPSVISRMSIARMPAADRTEAGVISLVQAMAGAGDVDFVSPVFRDPFGPWIVTKHLHIGFHQDVPPEVAEAILAEEGAGVIVARNWSRMPGVFRVRSLSRDGFDVLATANRLAQRDEVKFAEPDVIFTGRWDVVLPNDPGFTSGLTWGLHNTGQSGGTFDMDMDAPEAWDVTQGDPSIIVVVMDTGVQQDHPDLNQIPGFDATGNGTGGGPLNECDGHGTTVAGTIAATINNNLGTVGIAPNCKVAGAKFGVSNVPCNGTFSAFSSWLVDSLDWAEQIGAVVTNNSSSFGSTSAHETKYNQTRSAGIVHFTSTGNGGFEGIPTPGSYSSVNAVSAVNRFGNRASFSQWGEGLFISAPGVSVYTTDETGSDGFGSGDYVLVNGTSYASPYTAGVAALLLSNDPTLSPAQVEGILANSSVDRGSPGYDTEYGWGFVNAAAALSASLECTAPVPPTTDIVRPNNRYLSISPPPSLGVNIGLRITISNAPAPYDVLNGERFWVGIPSQVTENSGGNASTPSPTFTAASDSCTPVFFNFSQFDVIHISGDLILPEATYIVQSISEICEPTSESSFSLALFMNTSTWGDIVGTCSPDCGPPDGDADFEDISSMVDKFRNLGGAPIKARTDLGPETPDRIIDFTDIPLVVDAFRGLPAPFPIPSPCS